MPSSCNQRCRAANRAYGGRRARIPGLWAYSSSGRMAAAWLRSAGSGKRAGQLAHRLDHRGLVGRLQLRFRVDPSHRIDFDTDTGAAASGGAEHRCPPARERIEYRVSMFGISLNYLVRKPHGEHRIVRANTRPAPRRRVESSTRATDHRRVNPPASGRLQAVLRPSLRAQSGIAACACAVISGDTEFG